jgi:hypothetical protein
MKELAAGRHNMLMMYGSYNRGKSGGGWRTMYRSAASNRLLPPLVFDRPGAPSVR